MSLLDGIRNNSLPELLAPAGNLECGITAYKYGADAVYAGLGRFNAREMGKNFTLSDMSKLSAYAKKHGKKYYLTLNTLVKDTEIEDLIPFIDKVRDIEPDAFILQDLGVVKILKNYYPDIALHASTQMGFHNSAGLNAASKIGFERVILERQVSLEEIQDMSSISPVEIEVFIHGALCCGLSGNCLFSSWMGGWSGNRGKCKQPCRRRYHGKVDGEKAGGFFFSPQDLYSLDIIGDLKDAGVSSLKIEGRLKQPDYIKNVVSAYRKVLDSEPGNERRVLGEARNILSGSLGRKWSHGFYFPEETKDLLQYDSMGVSGQLIGKAGQIKTSGFQVKLSRRLHMGDRIRIQPSSGEEGPAVTITRLSIGSRPVNTGRQGDTVFVHCRKEIPAGGMVYKIGESRKEDIPDTANLPEYSAPERIDIQIRLDSTGMSARVKGRSGNNKIEVVWNEPPEPAGNRPLDGEKLLEVFSATRNPELKPGRIETEIEGAWFLPASILKKRRREFWEKVSTEYQLSPEKGPTVIEFPAKAGGPDGLLSLFSPEGRKTEKRMALPEEARGLKEITVISISDFLMDGKQPVLESTEILLPHFCPEKDLKKLKKGVDECLKIGIRRFRITSIYQFEFFDKQGDTHGLILTAAFPLPASNSFAVYALKLLGANRSQAWIELEKEALEKLIENSPLPIEQYTRGKPFLLATRAPVKVEGQIQDSRGGQFLVKREKNYGLDYIYPEKILELPVMDGVDIYLENVTGEEISTFNFEQNWV
ncbi:MAG: U32 family peptidase [Spirochaetales bacterium]|nr:U32 family peptidase [Spirochaetales bacterium]